MANKTGLEIKDKVKIFGVIGNWKVIDKISNFILLGRLATKKLRDPLFGNVYNKEYVQTWAIIKQDSPDNKKIYIDITEIKHTGLTSPDMEENFKEFVLQQLAGADEFNEKNIICRHRHKCHVLEINNKAAADAFDVIGSDAKRLNAKP